MIDSNENLNSRPENLEKLLLYCATTNSNLSIPNGIKFIDLGEIGQIASQLRIDTQKDPQKRERGICFFAMPDKNGIVAGKIDVGSQQEIVYSSYEVETTYTTPYRTNPQNIYPAIHIHTHGIVDVPPSPPDYFTLFLEETEPQASPSIAVVTPEITIIAFRGEKTPQLSFEKTNQKIKYWEKSIEDTIRNFRRENPKESAENLAALTQMDFSRFLREHYDIRFYACLPNQNIATEISA